MQMTSKFFATFLRDAVNCGPAPCYLLRAQKVQMISRLFATAMQSKCARRFSHRSDAMQSLFAAPHDANDLEAICSDLKDLDANCSGCPRCK